MTIQVESNMTTTDREQTLFDVNAHAELGKVRKVNTAISRRLMDCDDAVVGHRMLNAALEPNNAMCVIYVRTRTNTHNEDCMMRTTIAICSQSMETLMTMQCYRQTYGAHKGAK